MLLASSFGRQMKFFLMATTSDASLITMRESIVQNFSFSFNFGAFEVTKVVVNFSLKIEKEFDKLLMTS